MDKKPAPPAFETPEALAAFWDEHDSEEYEGEIEDVRYIAKRSVLSVRFEPGDHAVRGDEAATADVVPAESR